MIYQGKKFVQRFDANTYLRIIDMWSRYDASREGDAETYRDLLTRCAQAGQRFLVFSIDSDFCFYPEEQGELVLELEKAGVEPVHITVHSDRGHDSFLLEPSLYAPHIHYALRDWRGLDGNHATLWPGFACRPLTEGFKQTNSRRHADVKTFHLSPHWDLNEKIAFFLRESA